MNYIANSVNRSAFQRLAIRELALLGVTVDPMILQAAKRNKKVSNILSDSVFGTDLSNVPSMCIDDFGPVPKFIVNSVQFLEKHLDVEGIFRRSGSTTRLKDLRSQVEAGGVLSKANPLDVANLLKQFFRELPNPLLTSALYRSFIESASLKECHSRSSAILNLCLLLPAPHLATLRHTMCFLDHVASMSEHNKMDASNLSICLAPNFLRGPPRKVKWRSSSRTCMSETCLLEAEIAVVRILILEAQNIGIIPDEILERQRREAEKSCLIPNAPLEKSLTEFELDHTKMKQGKPSLQGLVTNLSSSFSRWHKRSKYGTISTHCGLDDLSLPTVIDSNSFLDRREFWNTSMCLMSTPVSKRKRKADDSSLEISIWKKKRLDANVRESSDRSFLLRQLLTSQNQSESAGISRLSDVSFCSEKKQKLADSTNLETPQSVASKLLFSTSSTKTSRDINTLASTTLSFTTPRRKIGRSVKDFLRLVSRKRNIQQLDNNKVVNISNTDQANMTAIIENKSCQVSKDFLQHDHQTSRESPHQSVQFDMSCNRELCDSQLPDKKRYTIRSQMRPHRRLFASSTSPSDSTDFIRNAPNQLNNSKIPSFDHNPLDCKESNIKTVPVHKGLIDTSPIPNVSLSTVNKENENFQIHHTSVSKQLALSHQALQTSPASLETSDDYDELVMESLAHDQAFSESIHLSEKSACLIAYM